MKKLISARIDEETLIYIKSTNKNVNGLINDLLAKWKNENKAKQLTLWGEDTDKDELSQITKNTIFKVSQCCNNCIHYKSATNWCNELQWSIKYRHGITFCCIYWEKKKGSH